jgi:hypothetical protein
MEDARAFGPMVAAEAYRRGLWQAPVVLNISDAGNWIDPLAELQRLADVRIIDFWHADERLFAVAEALHGKQTRQARALGEKLESLLYQGQVGEVIAWMQEQSKTLGPPQEGDGPTHPREVLHQNLGYFQALQAHMHYDELSSAGMADRLRQCRGRRQGIQQKGQGNRSVLESSGRRSHHGPARPVDVSGRTLGTLLE